LTALNSASRLLSTWHSASIITATIIIRLLAGDVARERSDLTRSTFIDPTTPAKAGVVRFGIRA
jgi:hypothetical protein